MNEIYLESETLLNTWSSDLSEGGNEMNLDRYREDTQTLKKDHFQHQIFRAKVCMLWSSYGCLVACLLSLLCTFPLLGDTSPVKGCPNVVGTCMLFPCSDNHNATCDAIFCKCSVGTCAPDGFLCSQAFSMLDEEDDYVYFGHSLTTYVVAAAAFFFGGLYFVSYSSWPSPIITNLAVIGLNRSSHPASLYNRWKRHILVWGTLSTATILVLSTLAVVVHGTPTTDWPISLQWFKNFFTTSIVVQCQSLRFTTESATFLCVGLAFIFISEVPHEAIGLDGYMVSLENAMRSPPITSQSTVKWQGLQDSMRLAQVMARLGGWNCVVLFWMQQDFWRGIMCLAFLVNQRVVFNCLILPFSQSWQKMEEVIFEKAQQRTASVEEGDEATRMKEINPTNVYMDFTKKFGVRVVLSFVGQWIVLGAYIAGMRDDVYEFLCKDVWVFHNWVMWFVVLIIQFLMTSALGSNFLDTLFDWYVILEGTHLHALEVMDTGDADSVQWMVNVRIAVESRPDRQGVSSSDEADFRCGWLWRLFGARVRKVKATNEKAKLFQQLCRPNSKTRFVMDFLSNGFIYMLLIMIVPIALINNTDGMDFAKDCVAIAFITVTDDLLDSDARSTLLAPLLRACTYSGVDGNTHPTKAKHMPQLSVHARVTSVEMRLAEMLPDGSRVPHA